MCGKLLLNSFWLYNLWYTSSVDKSVPNVCEPFSGDYEGAIDTLRMAITLIKQSVTANSEASQVRHCALRAQRLVQFHTVPLITFTTCIEMAHKNEELFANELVLHIYILCCSADNDPVTTGLFTGHGAAGSSWEVSCIVFPSPFLSLPTHIPLSSFFRPPLLSPSLTPSLLRRYRSSGGGGGGSRGEHMSSRHMHDMREMRDIRDIREMRDMRDFRDERGMRGPHKPSKHHRDRSRERRR